LRDWHTNQGSIPLLADTQTVIGVGAANLSDEPEPWTTAGAPGTLWNVMKPNVLAYDRLQLAPAGSGSAYGASLSTPFAAGVAASLLSGGSNREALQGYLQKQEGKLLRVQMK
jgi:subtilisin family serine protease